MRRFRLTLEYDGSPFVGWQRQDNGPSIQGALEDAIEKFSGARVTVTGAGRTDAGVHALGQMAHFDLEKARRATSLVTISPSLAVRALFVCSKFSARAARR